ncbi:Aquaporin-10 [Aphelenchoides bicaudatus]|nr:Aquaporin-10 [Aphelenchoides bicaudatus]
MFILEKIQRRRAHFNWKNHRRVNSPPKLPTAAKKPEKSAMDKFREVLTDKLGTENSVVRAILAEFIGTFFLLFIGLSANIQQAITGASETSAQLAWGFGFAFAVYCSATVSGGHLNPAISLSSLIIGDLNIGRFIVYVIAQLLGAFVGSAAAYLGHIDDINFLDNGQRSIMGGNATAALFATFPSSHISILGSLVDQIIGTATLAFCVALITDKRHQIPTGLIPLLAGFTMSMISMTYGSNGGFAINPARDLGPRLFLLCVGYGWSLFTVRNYYFWIPIVGPLIGAILGTWIYKIFVGIHGGTETLDITDSKMFYGRDNLGYKRHLSTDNENREPTPLSWRKMTVPEFPADSRKKPIEAYQHPIQHQNQSQVPYSAHQQQPIYSTVLTARKEEDSSLRREPDLSPPPLPTSQPPPVISYDQPERTFVEELKQRNARQPRNSGSSAISRNQEEQTVTLFAEPDQYQKKQNGPIKSEKLFNELFTAPSNRGQPAYSKHEYEHSDDQDRKPQAPPRRFQTDRPDIQNQVSVSLSYHPPPNDENQKPKVFI